MFAIGPIAIGMVVLWLVATAAHQYVPFQRVLGRLDPLKLLPSWRFFAPNPANRDSHIVFRDIHSDGTVSGWRPVCFFPTRHILQLVWHPAKRPRKILRDAAKSIKQTRRAALSKGVVQCSLPYLIVLHYCLAQHARATNAVARQFAIIETSGREDRRIWITFISEFHRF